MFFFVIVVPSFSESVFDQLFTVFFFIFCFDECFLVLTEYYSGGGNGVGQGAYNSYGGYDQPAYGGGGGGGGGGGSGAGAPGGWGNQASVPSAYQGYAGSDNQSGGYSTQPSGGAPSTAYPIGSSSAGYSAYEQSYGGGYDNAGPPYGAPASYGGTFLVFCN